MTRPEINSTYSTRTIPTSSYKARTKLSSSYSRPRYGGVIQDLSGNIITDLAGSELQSQESSNELRIKTLYN